MELALWHMARGELEQIKRLFNTAFYLVQAERPYSNFPGLVELQARNGLTMGSAYCNEKQAKVFISFIAEEIRSKLVSLMASNEFFSVSFDSSTDQGNIDEEIMQVRVLEDSFPVYKFVAVKRLHKPDALNTVTAVVEALESDCELPDWKLKLVGLSADGAAVNMGIRSGAAKRLKDMSPHLVSVHCCAHRLELAIKSVGKSVPYFRALEDVLQDLYKLYKSPLCWSGLQEVGQALKLTILKPAKVTRTRWRGHRERALKILVKGWKDLLFTQVTLLRALLCLRIGQNT